AVELRPASAAPAAPTAAVTDIAVIGMAGRFPDAPDLTTFWDNLAAGRCSLREVPPDRFDIDAAYDPDRLAADRTYSRWAGMLADVASFDAGLFHLSPLDAQAMDPQQRLFLSEAWHALEDAGYATSPGQRRPWGVFAGCAAGDYARLLADAGEGGSGQAFLGNSCAMLPARVGYLLNLSGPTMAVDTACSSSLVAVHLACESIRRGECEAALAGGVAVMNTAQMHIWCSRTGMLSPTGTCAPFDASADGIVLGEGVGVVVLKRLDRALADGDHIHGVIRGSGSNGDGKTNGITAPSATSQADLLRAVYARAGVAPAEVGYVEAHGTGTPLGDPIEVKALTEVYGGAGPRVDRCGLGSVKANIGHTTMAAGIAGLLVALLALRHRKLPPAPRFTTANPKINLDAGPFRIVTELTDFPTGPGGRRTAAVSSFGFSGTNCHVVVSEAVGGGAAPAPRRAEPVLVPVSARTPAALVRSLTALADRLAAEPGTDLDDLAYTLSVGRRHLPERVAVVAADTAELERELRRLAGQDGPAARPATPSNGPLGRLAARYLAGEDVDWVAWYAGARRRRIPLPGYAFDDERHWVRTPDAGTPDAGAPESDEDGAVVVRRRLRPDEWLLADHRIGDTAVLPGAACLEMAVAAADRFGVSWPVRISGVRWLRPFELSGPRPVELSLSRVNGHLAFEL
ncbi:MAG TPA: beta-ketoacyl synthase N-terminal-like domain-containing protein, partial [Micromonosporaceae bacterium]|nr:beta-ketoacyl synthase N-terminal-like domain-containing protein [Micromonosporaceae bacterium]